MVCWDWEIGVGGKRGNSVFIRFNWFTEQMGLYKWNTKWCQPWQLGKCTAKRFTNQLYAIPCTHWYTHYSSHPNDTIFSSLIYSFVPHCNLYHSTHRPINCRPIAPIRFHQSLTHEICPFIFTHIWVRRRFDEMNWKLFCTHNELWNGYCWINCDFYWMKREMENRRRRIRVTIYFFLVGCSSSSSSFHMPLVVKMTAAMVLYRIDLCWRMAPYGNTATTSLVAAGFRIRFCCKYIWLSAIFLVMKLKENFIWGNEEMKYFWGKWQIVNDECSKGGKDRLNCWIFENCETVRFEWDLYKYLWHWNHSHITRILFQKF